MTQILLVNGDTLLGKPLVMQYGVYILVLPLQTACRWELQNAQDLRTSNGKTNRQGRVDAQRRTVG